MITQRLHPAGVRPGLVSFVLAVALCLGMGPLRAAAPDEPAAQPASPAAPGLLTLTLQYRTAGDALAPSRFVAVYDGGLRGPLTIHWRMAAEDKARLDALLLQLEREGRNGVEFSATMRWLQRGLEAEVFAMR